MLLVAMHMADSACSACVLRSEAMPSGWRLRGGVKAVTHL